MLRQMAAKAMAQKANIGTSSANSDQESSMSIGTIGMSNAQRKDYDHAKNLKNDELRQEIMALGQTQNVSRMNKDQLIKLYLSTKLEVI